MIRQFRYAPRTWLLEAPAVRVEAGETAVSAAIRELREETGYHCASVEKLGEIRISPHLSDETTHVYLATGLRADVPEHDLGELIGVENVPTADLRRYVEQGLLIDAKTIATFVLAGLLP